MTHELKALSQRPIDSVVEVIFTVLRRPLFKFFFLFPLADSTFNEARKAAVSSGSIAELCCVQYQWID